VSQSDDHGRSESQPSGSGGGPQYGQPQYGQPHYGQPHYGAPQYGQPHYGAPQQGQPQYGDPQQFTAPVSYGQQPYPQQHGQPGFDQPYGAYGASAAPARPGGVITAAVLGFLFGAIGLLISFLLILGGAVASTAGDDIDQEIPGFGSMAGAIGGLVLVVGLVALAWTVVMIWGSVWALTGRSRVLLLVGGSVALAVAVLGMLGSIANSGTADIVGNLLFLGAALAIVVLLSMTPAAQFFAQHRYGRSGR
jgi:hypothetical protein